MKADEYRKMAAVEDRMWYYRALHALVSHALKRAKLGPEAKVLDAGCGTGGLLRRLHAASPAWSLTGLDFSPLACEFTRERTGLSVREGSVLELPFGTKEFDAVSACDVICQVPVPPTAVKELFRVLRPGGTAVLTMPAYAWMYSYHDRAVGNLQRYSRAQTQTLLKAAGFVDVTGTYWNTLLFPLAVLQRKILPSGSGRSDVRLYPRPLEAICRAMMAIEYAWISGGRSLPWGNSVLVTGRKPLDA